MVKLLKSISNTKSKTKSKVGKTKKIKKQPQLKKQKRVTKTKQPIDFTPLSKEQLFEQYSKHYLIYRTEYNPNKILRGDKVTFEKNDKQYVGTVEDIQIDKTNTQQFIATIKCENIKKPVFCSLSILKEYK